MSRLLRGADKKAGHVISFRHNTSGIGATVYAVTGIKGGDFPPNLGEDSNIRQEKD